MDPLSLVASVLAVNEAALSTAKFVQRVCATSSEIQSLVSTLQDIDLLVKNAEGVLAVRTKLQVIHDGDLVHQALKAVLDRALRQLTELDGRFKGYFKPSDSVEDVRRSAKVLWIKGRTRMVQSMQELQRVKQDLMALWTLSNASDLTFITQQLDRLAQDVGKLSDNRDDGANKPTNWTMQSPPTTVVTQQPSIQLFNAVPHVVRASQLSRAPVSKLQHFVDEPIWELQNECRPWCSCICHKTTHYTSPESWIDWIGVLALTVTGRLLMATPCSEKSCIAQSRRSMRLSYQLPLWVLARRIYVAVRYAANTSPELLLRVQRVCPPNAEIFLFATTGNITGIRKLFSKGLASPYDVEHGTGVSALHKAIDWRQCEAAQLLAKEGSDPFLEDNNGWSPADNVCQLVFAGGPEKILVFEALLRSFNGDIFETQEFSTLHKIILGLLEMDLEKQLLLTTAELDLADTCGQTPLFWAATRGDVKSVRLLLEYGADPHHRSVLKETALHWAMEPQHGDCTKLLLNYGADPNAASIFGTTPLHYAVRTHDDPDIHARLLVEAGANVNATNKQTRTPLHYVCCRDNPRSLQYLIDQQAHIEAVDQDGYTPLLEAVRQDLTRLIACLLEQGADISTRTSQSQTVFHLLAQYGSGDSVTLFEVVDTSEVDLEARSRDGKSIMDVLEERPNIDIALKLQFEALLVDTAVKYPIEVVVEEIDVFEDAVELL